MNKYESVIIVKPNLSEKELSELVLKVEGKIREFAEITEKQDLGKRRLAYEIKNNKEGYYFVYQFEIDVHLSNKAIKEIERFYRITDEIMKYIVIKEE